MQATMVREQIIETFRDRIRQGDRLRLSKNDLQDLIAGFLEQLTRTESEADIQRLCEAEIQLLEEGYPQASVAKYLTVYRKAIAAAIEDGSLPLTERNSHRFVHQQRVTGIQEERFEHWALTYLKYSPEVYGLIDRRSQQVNRDKQMNLRLVPVEAYLDLIRTFLSKKGMFEARWLATAIAGLTGRRFAEVVAKGTFTLTPHPYLLRFEGQLKSRAARPESYDIVTLIPAAEVLESIARLRKLPEVRAITKLKGKALSEELNRFNQKLNQICGKALQQVVPPLEGKKSVSVHNLRSLYGAIAVYQFCPPLQHEYAFIQHFLGHVMDSPATGHYFRFALCDNVGQPLRDKGILLATIDPLPLHAESPAAESSTPAQPPLPSPQTAPPQPWQILLERRLEALRSDLEAQLKEVRQESHAGWFVRRIEGLERENLHLRSQLEQAASVQPSLEQTELRQMEQELEQLRAENLTLTQQLKQAQDTLDGFRRLLNSEVPPAALPEPLDAPVEPEARQTTLPVITPPEDSEPETPAVQVVPLGQTKARGPLKGKAMRRAEAIFAAIKVWNRQFPAESFAINPGLLETVFRIHRQAAKEFFEVYQNELWDYHQEIGVESPRWHNRGKDTLRLKEFVMAQLES